MSTTIHLLMDWQFVEIYCNNYDPVVPPEKMYGGLVYFEEWYTVNTPLYFSKY